MQHPSTAFGCCIRVSSGCVFNVHSGLCAECDIQLQCGGTTVRCTQPPPNEDEPTLPWCARCLSPSAASAVWFPRWAHYRRQLNATSEYGIWLLYSREFRLCIQRALGPVCQVQYSPVALKHERTRIWTCYSNMEPSTMLLFHLASKSHKCKRNLQSQHGQNFKENPSWVPALHGVPGPTQHGHKFDSEILSDRCSRI